MYKVRFKAKSGFKSNLTSMTLFGASCQALSDLGKEDIIDKFESGNEYLVFSNTFIDGYELVDTESIVGVDDIEELYEFSNHDRFRKGTDGKLSSTEFWESRDLYFLIETSLNSELLNKILNILFVNGIGAGKSIGLGQFELLEIIPNFEFSKAENDSNTYMVLSDYIPNPADSTLGDFTARIIKGKDKNGISKTPVYVINAGSKFIGKLSTKFIGQIVRDESTGTLISGQALVKRI